MALLARFADVIDEIADAGRSVKILSALAWPDEVRERFFAAGATELPEVHYTVRFDWPKTVARFEAIRKRITIEKAGGDLPDLERLLSETCESYISAARMLGAVGTRAFYHHSIE